MVIHRQLHEKKLNAILLPVLALVVIGFQTRPLTAEEPSDAATATQPVSVALEEGVAQSLARKVPTNLADLKAIESQSAKVVAAVEPTLVHVIVGTSVRGSGVVVSEDGLVLTAGHVNGAVGRNVTFIFPDGKRVRGKTLGSHQDYDAGLMQITSKGKWTYAQMAPADSIETGEWCIAMGHPGGYDADRPNVTRIGRVIRATPGTVQTDCTIVGGDSGGPLFDMQGRVIAIHSRINQSMSGNYHVPIDTYHRYMAKMRAGETLGGRSAPRSRTDRGFLGIQGETVDNGVEIVEVIEGTAAAKAKIAVGDIVTKIDDKKMTNIVTLVRTLGEKRPGETVTIELLRDGKKKRLKVKLGRFGE